VPAWLFAGGGGGSILEYTDNTPYTLIASAGSVGTSVVSIALSPDSTTLYTGDTNSGLISSFVATTLAPITTTTLAIGPASRITVYPANDGSALFVAERGANKIWVLNPTTLATVTTFSTVATAPTGMVQLPGAGGHLYIACETGSAVEVRIPVAPWTVVTTITVGTDPLVLAANFTGTLVYCLNVLNGPPTTISVITTASNTVTSTINLTGSTAVVVSAMTISADNKYLYVGGAAGPGTTDAWLVNTSTLAQTHFNTVATNNFVAVTKDAARAWYTVVSPSTAEIYSVPTNTLLHTITGGGGGPVVTTPNPFIIGNPFIPSGTVTIPPLFIPRKGLPEYEGNDYMIDLLTIERWAQGIH
jgi:DNA-binding beta-propeller fold protein YncE